MKILKISTKLFIFTIIGIICALVCLYSYAYLSPKPDIKTPGNFFLYDNKGELVYQGSKTSKWVELDNISTDLINATIAYEDKDFYDHDGFDYTRIASAIYNNIKSNTLDEGASTITQQYAKNMYLTFDKTWERKIEEAFLTLELEVHYTKDQILEGYLNTIYYGHGNYGIENASQYYFNKDSKDLTLEEAVMLAAIPNRPNSYNPVTDYDLSIKRAKLVAKAMLDNEYITEEEYDSMFLNEIAIHGKHTENDLQMLMYYQDAVLNELKNLEVIPDSLIEAGGLQIYTTLDISAQQLLEEKILNNIVDDEQQVAGLISIPDTGAIVALTGGVNYDDSTYNRAISSVRQVGSTMKPFLYYAALENNLTMASTFKSEHTVFSLSNNQVYSPSNFNSKYANKDITMAAAMAFSDNIYAVKTNLFLGVDKLIDTAKLTGITGNLDEVASLALGTSELNIIDLATGYTTFASGGYKKELYFIEKIEDMEGNVLYEKKHKEELVLNPNYTYILNEMMAGTTSDKFSDYTSATGLSIKNTLTRKYAIKSGTTSTDNWNVGYNQDVLVALWMGYDEGKETTSEISRAERNALAEILEGYFIDRETSWYDMPKNVVGVMLDAVTGKEPVDASSSTIFYFLKGTEPIYN